MGPGAAWQGATALRARIRRAGPRDARAIAEVTVAGWRAAYREILPGEFLDSMSVDGRETALTARLSRDRDGAMPAWVAEAVDGIAGYVSSGPLRDDDVPLPAAEVYALYVRPEVWRRGLGRTLLSTAAEHWRAAGATTLVLWVFEKNAAARTFYELAGWRPDGARQPIDVGGVVVPEVRYRRHL